MKITLKPQLFQKRGTMTRIAEDTGINYQTVMKLVGKGEFSPRTFRILGLYFEALGYTAQEIAEMKMGDIFEIK